VLKLRGEQRLVLQPSSGLPGQHHKLGTGYGAHVLLLHVRCFDAREYMACELIHFYVDEQRQRMRRVQLLLRLSGSIRPAIGWYG
jgi:hypothetical protein